MPQLRIVDRPLLEEIDLMLRPKLAERQERLPKPARGYIYEDGLFGTMCSEIATTTNFLVRSGGKPVIFVVGPGHAKGSFALKFLHGGGIYLAGADVREYSNVKKRRELSQKVRDRWPLMPLPKELADHLYSDAVNLLSWIVPQGVIPKRDEILRMEKEWLTRARRKRVIPNFDQFIMKSIEDFTIPGQVDVIQCMLVLPDVTNPPRALENMLNSLKPGGKILLGSQDLVYTALTEERLVEITQRSVEEYGTLCREGKIDNMKFGSNVLEDMWRLRESIDSTLVKSLRVQGFKVEYVVCDENGVVTSVESEAQVKRADFPYFRIAAPARPVQCNLREFYRLDGLDTR